MAEGGQATESRTVIETCKQTCSICLDIFRKPHTLPCDHKFCALCLIGYLQKCLNTEGKDIFPCPLCRSEIRVSNYRKVNNEDVTKLDLLSFSQISVENESRKEFDDSCEPCKRGKDNVKATNFCSDCNESLCAGCVTHHLRNKLTCRHVVTNLEDRENKANTIPLDKEYHLKTKCNLHNMKKMKYICIDHDILCCSKCVISDHRKCLDIQSVSDFSKSSQCDEMVQAIKRLFESIYKDGDKVKSDQVERISVLTRKASDYGKTITQLEKEMHKELSNIFCTLKTPVVDEFKNQKERSKQALEKVEQLESRISHIKNSFDYMKVSSDACLNVTICLEVLKRLKSERKTVSELVGSLASANTLQTETEMEPVIKHFTETLQSACHRLSSDGCILIAHDRSERPKLRQHISAAAKINDITILQNENAVIAYSDKTLTLTDSCLKPIMRIIMSSQPTSVTECSQNIVAVALPEEKKLAVITLYRNTHGMHSFKQDKPFICLASGSLKHARIVVAYAPETGTLCYQIVESSVSNDWKVIPLHFYHVNKICIDGTAQIIYIAQYKINKITGINLQGKVNFVFTHHQLHMPFGLFFGQPDKLYVCSYGTQQVNEITPSKREFKDVLCRTEGLRGPLAVAFNKALTRCLVYDDDQEKQLKLFDM